MLTNARNFQENDLLGNLCCTRACELLRYHRNKSGGRPSNDSFVHMGMFLQRTKVGSLPYSESRHSRDTVICPLECGDDSDHTDERNEDHGIKIFIVIPFGIIEYEGPIENRLLCWPTAS